MTTLSIDIETYSSVNLAKSGVYKYVESPDFEVLFIAYTLVEGDMAVSGVIDVPNCKDPFIEQRPLLSMYGLQMKLRDPNVLKTAWNAAFERTALSKYFGIELPPEQWRCTMTWAAQLGLPLGLDQCAKVLGVSQKDKLGKSLIKYFCEPCKPTAANGGRTRNLPHHNPAKWEQFKAYCAQDVVVEREIESKVRFFPYQEHEVWCLDQRINDRGVAVDMDLVEKALEIDATVTERLVREATTLTGIDNVGSVAQLKQWLTKEMGEEVESLSKNDMPDLIKRAGDASVKRVLEIRQELSKSSVKKYVAMKNAVCADGRVRGLLQYYGANRTGRWAGRLVQVQNLPGQNLPERDLELARDLVKAGDLQMIDALYDNVPDVLSQLIRTAFVADTGKTLIVSDFSAIEARVIAWYAREQWRLDVFKTHGKIYEASASQMFKVPLEEVSKDLRKKGKVAELACIAKGSLVLTDKGLVPIEKVKKIHRVWDGNNFVSHDGVVFKGYKSVIDYEGLSATADHLVWIEGEPRPVQFGYAAACGSRLCKSGNGGQAIRVGEDHKSGKAIHERLVQTYGANEVHGVRSRTMDQLPSTYTRQKQRLSNLLTTEADTRLVKQEAVSGKEQVQQTKGPWLPQLRRKGHRVPFQVGVTGRVICYDASEVLIHKQGLTNRPHRQQQTLRAWKYKVGYTSKESAEQKGNSIARVFPGAVALREIRSNSVFKNGYVEGGYNRTCKASRSEQKKELERHSRKVAVYDILNAGPLHRFTVSGVLVHNCGYGGGVGALLNMGALKMGLAESDLQPIIDAWRLANPNIVRFWKDCERTAKQAMLTGDAMRVPGTGIVYQFKHGNLFCKLPSGRMLSYYKAGLQDGEYGKEIFYWGMDQVTKQWKKIKTYSGKLVENCLSQDTLVLTDTGWKEIVNVSITDRVWDGVEFVEHSGVISQGSKQTVSVNGLRLTPDHKILTEDGWKNASSCGGSYRSKVTLPYGREISAQRWKKEIRVGDSVRLREGFSDGRLGVQKRETEKLRLPKVSKNKRVSNPSWKVKASTVLGVAIHEGEMLKRKPQAVSQLRRQRYNRMRKVAGVLRELLGRYAPSLAQRAYPGAYRREQRLLPSELHVFQLPSASAEQAVQCAYRNALGAYDRSRSIAAKRNMANNYSVPFESRGAGTPLTVKAGRYEPVYDLLNCGPRSRFVVMADKPTIVHNCVQATARDILADKLKALSEFDWSVVMHVHDEIVIEGWEGDLDDVNTVMREDLPWAPGLPLGSAGFESTYYKKD